MNRDNFLIEADELLNILDDENVRIFDATILFYINLSREEAANMPTAYEQYLQGHIPGAAFFDHQVFSDSSSDYMYMILSETELAAQIGNIASVKNQRSFFSRPVSCPAQLAPGGYCVMRAIITCGY